MRAILLLSILFSIVYCARVRNIDDWTVPPQDVNLGVESFGCSEFRYLFEEAECGVAATVFLENTIGGGREMYVQSGTEAAVAQGLSPADETGPGTILTLINPPTSALPGWETQTAQIDALTEYTLDGFLTDPLVVDYFPGISVNAPYDLTDGGRGYGIRLLITSQQDANYVFNFLESQEEENAMEYSLEFIPPNRDLYQLFIPFSEFIPAETFYESTGGPNFRQEILTNLGAIHIIQIGQISQDTRIALLEVFGHRISGTVWRECDNNCLTIENRAANQVIELFRQGESSPLRTTTTNSQGYYFFTVSGDVLDDDDGPTIQYTVCVQDTNLSFGCDVSRCRNVDIIRASPTNLFQDPAFYQEYDDQDFPIASQFSITAPPSQTFECDANTDPTSQATVIDTCSNPSVTWSDGTAVSGTCADRFTFTRTWIGTSGSGEERTAPQTIFVVDTTPPTLNPTTVELSFFCSDDLVIPKPTATDNCDPSPKVTSSFVDSGDQCQFTRTFTYTATDRCNNVNPSTFVQKVSVTDETAPTFSIFPKDTTIDCDQIASTKITGSPTAIDACDNGAEVTFTDSTTKVCAGGVLLQITRSWRTFDECNNQSPSRNQLITVNELVPELIFTSGQEVVSKPCSERLIHDVPPVALDSCSPEYDNATPVPTVTNFVFDPLEQTSCPLRATVTWSITSPCGSSDSITQTYLLSDDQPPSFVSATLPPTSLSINCTDEIPNYNIQATDDCSGVAIVTGPQEFSSFGPQIGRCPAEKILTRVWTATDSCGSANRFTQVISIETTPPFPCIPVPNLPSPCNQASCPRPDCNCCGREPFDCNPTSCQPSLCQPSICNPVPCSGCDVPIRVTTCQPRVCPPTYVYFDDDDSITFQRNQIRKAEIENNSTASNAVTVMISAVLIIVMIFALIISI